MVDLIARISAYAKGIDPGFKIVLQNGPELHDWSKYLPAIDGLDIKESYFQATDIPCYQNW